ncbi:MAG: hypothetical protein GOU99_01895 [Candidatus Altiarchaeota archaeon]|nr:hypothetical protein [Candidatus Altiarchaeota archaeon]
MRAQLSLEFLVIMGLVIGYLVAVIGLYAQTRDTLLYGIDRLTVRRVERWTSFVSDRPVGTEIQYKLSVFSNRFLNISCGPVLVLSTPLYSEELAISSVCEPVSYDSCIKITSTGQGVELGACD